MVAAITFWALASKERPIPISYELGLLLQDNPKRNTTLWTALGSILSAFTLYMLRSILVLLSKHKLEEKGASLSTIECAY